MKNHSVLLLLAFAALLLQSCSPAKSLGYENAFRPGDRLLYRQTELTETVAETPSGESSASTTQKITDYAYTVRAVGPDGSVDFDFRITHLYEKEDGDNGVKEYDSANPDQDTTEIKARLYRHLIGAPFHFTLSAKGQVTTFEGMDALWQKLEQELSQDAPEAATMFKALKAQFGDESMRAQQSLFWGYQPAGKVRVGQKWKRETTLNAFHIQGKTTYTLREHDERGARITYATRYNTDAKNPGVMDFDIVKIRYNLSGTGSGAILTDPSAALPRRVEQTVEMSGPMEIKMSFLDWMKIPVTVKVTSVMERMK